MHVLSAVHDVTDGVWGRGASREPFGNSRFVVAVLSISLLKFFFLTQNVSGQIQLSRHASRS